MPLDILGGIASIYFNNADWSGIIRKNPINLIGNGLFTSGRPYHESMTETPLQNFVNDDEWFNQYKNGNRRQRKFDTENDHVDTP